MELEGTVFFDEEWDSLSKMFSTENVDLMVHLKGDDIFLNDHENGASCEAPLTFWQAVEANKMINVTKGFFSSNCSDALINTDNKLQEDFSQESRTNSSGNGSFLIDPNAVQSECMDFLVKNAENCNSDPFSEILCLKEEEDGQLKRKLKNDSTQNPKKKPQLSREGQKNKRNPQSKRKQKIIDNSNEEEEEEEEEEEGQNTQSSSCSSIDETETSECKGKTRASRGAATDPQSLYARRRREKINERLRILQSLVPNGTKVDISTMLEEAVHYVKFLQLQIKLLSSDDMWMYAPIAYNGMDIGHFQKMLQPTL